MWDVTKYYQEIDNKFKTVIEKNIETSKIIDLETIVFSFFSSIDDAYKSSFKKKNPKLHLWNNLYYFSKLVIDEIEYEPSFKNSVTIDQFDDPDKIYSSIVKVFYDNFNEIK